MLDYYISWDFAITSEKLWRLHFGISYLESLGNRSRERDWQKDISKALHLDDKVADRFRVDNKNLIF